MRPLRWLGWPLLLTFLAALPGPSTAQTDPLDYRLQARQIAPDVYVVEGANADLALANGCNIINTGFIVTGAGVVVINSGPSRRYGEQLRALITRTTPEPIVKLVHLNQHPDYFLGNQAFADVPRAATPTTLAGMRAQAANYEANLFRLCGDWMKGTSALLPDAVAMPGVQRLGRHEIELLELRGHTDSDLVLIDRTHGIVFAGGLVFSQRIPTTPDAEIKAWQASLQTLLTLPYKNWVPSHGSIAAAADKAGVILTQRYLTWLDTAFRGAAERGLDMVEVLNMPVPEEFRQWAGFETEYIRNVANLYPGYEQTALKQGRR